jgi:hypothetical protein
MPDSEDTPVSFPIPDAAAEPVAIETCTNCHSLCPIGDVDADGVCSDCREISDRVRALKAPAPRPMPDRPEPWWNRD